MEKQGEMQPPVQNREDGTQADPSEEQTGSGNALAVSPTPPAGDGPKRSNPRLSTHRKITLPARARWDRAVTQVLRAVRLVHAFLPPEARERKAQENAALLRRYKGLPPLEEGHPGGVGLLARRGNLGEPFGAGAAAFLPQLLSEPRSPQTSAAKSLTSTLGFTFSHGNDPSIRCRAILGKRFEARSRGETHFVLDLLQRVPLFRRMDPETQLEITKVLQLRDFDEHDCIVASGDEYRYLCILLSGKVKFLSRTAGVELEVCTYGPWDVFGQAVLSHPDPVKSTTTILAAADTTVLLIDKRRYLAHFSRLEEAETQRRLHFFRSVPAFREVPEGELRLVVKACRCLRLPHNSVVVKEGAKRTHAYVLRRGECRLLRRCRLPYPAAAAAAAGGSPEKGGGGGAGGQGGGVVFVELGLLRPRDVVYEPAGAAHPPRGGGSGEAGGSGGGRSQHAVHEASVVTTVFSEVYAVPLADLKALGTPALAAAWRRLQAAHAARAAFAPEDLARSCQQGRNWEAYKARLVGDAVRARGGDEAGRRNTLLLQR